MVIAPSGVTDNRNCVGRGYFEPLDHPSTGACGIRGRRSPPSRGPAGGGSGPRRPRLASTPQRCSKNLCGVTDEELARLTADGVIGTRPKGL